MKSVGIVTMHKVLNYGSALQAYALQRKIDELGFKATIIDYLYPNKFHCERQKIPYYPKKSMARFAAMALLGVLVKLLRISSRQKKANAAIKRFFQQRAFRSFYQKYFNLSREYASAESLGQIHEKFDIYMTGSDQVWNPQYMVGDTNFLLGFAPRNALKCSYAASFSGKDVSDEMQPLYRKFLEQYQFISVREKSASNVVEKLIGKAPEVVCDPTLLLNRDEWTRLCVDRPLVNGKYLLVYILHYSFDPYPSILSLVDMLARERNLKVVVLHGLKDGYSIENSISFDSIGPLEFLRLFRDASLVVTTSFHGTAFALNFARDFYSVIKRKDGSDNRIADFLSVCGAEHHLVEMNDLENLQESSVTAIESEKLMEFRDRSIAYLREKLMNVSQ